MKSTTAPLVVLWVIGFFMLFYYGFLYIPQQAGDIANYLGVTESIINHQSLELRLEDKEHLKTMIHPAYFDNPIYYNIIGRNGNYYSMHFVAYPLLITPIRMVVELLKLNPLRTFPIANTIIIIAMLTYLLSREKEMKKRWLLLLLTSFSPLISFIPWIGPDLLILALLLLSAEAWKRSSFWHASIFAALASWHSQPLLVLAMGMTVYAWIKQKQNTKLLLIVSTLAGVPYLYNLWAFGALTPWTLLSDGWTRLYGFGIQNIRIEKLWSQFFDLNMGIFWYAPLLVIIWLYNLNKHIVLSTLLILTAFAYQTNPAFHYGTAGFGPSRHIIFLIPFLIMATLAYLSNLNQNKRIYIIGSIFVSQLFILNMNGGLSPNFENTLQFTPIAKFALSNTPQLYNPLPEIFVDRTNHTDLDQPSSAIFLSNGTCKKAFILPQDIDNLLMTCPNKPTKSSGTILNPETDGIMYTYE